MIKMSNKYFCRILAILAIFFDGCELHSVAFKHGYIRRRGNDINPHRLRA